MRGCRFTRLGVAALVGMAFLLAFAPVGASAGPDADAQLVPLAMEIPNPPVPVEGADGRVHLAYEINISNRSQLAVNLDSVQSLTAGKAIGAPLVGDTIADRLRHDDGAKGTTIAGGTGATLFMDVTYPPERNRPSNLEHRFRITLTDASGSQAPNTMEFTGVATRVSRANPIEVDPPLRGNRWLVANGCCTLNDHRAATLAIDGTAHTPERFAIDFVQLNAANRLFDGENVLANYAYFGSPIRAATGGKVVRIQDDQPEQIPGRLPEGQTVQTAGGNYVVVKIDRRHFAFYAHLQSGSLAVEPGDRVRAGDRIGLLGNTGNTDGPHLHFHIMDSPSPLRSNGLPYTFTGFRGQGLAADTESLPQGGTATVDPGPYAGRHRDQIPLQNELVGFP